MLLSRMAHKQKAFALPAIFSLVVSCCLMLCSAQMSAAPLELSEPVKATEHAHPPCHGEAPAETTDASGEPHCGDCDTDSDLISQLQQLKSGFFHASYPQLTALASPLLFLPLTEPRPPPLAKRPLYLTKNVFLI
ncbi:MAG TPA: hypothetical protein VIC08_04370 [Cellvibrionaceae bacterium]